MDDDSSPPLSQGSTLPLSRPPPSAVPILSSQDSHESSGAAVAPDCVADPAPPPHIDFAAEIARQIRDAQAKHTDHLCALGTSLQNTMQTMQTSNDTKFKHVSSSMKVLLDRVVNLERLANEGSSRTAAVEQRIATDATIHAQTHSVDLDEWDREADPTLVILRAKVDLAKAGAERSAKELCLMAAIPDDCWQLEGDEMAKEFSIIFSTAESVGIAKRRANKVLSSLRRGPSEWTRIYADDSSGERHQLFVGKDENKKSAKTRFWIEGAPPGHAEGVAPQEDLHGC